MLRGKVEIKQNPRGVPASRRPQHECQEEDEDAKPFPLPSDRGAFTDRPQYFGALRDIDKQRPRNFTEAQLARNAEVTREAIVR